jgi:hypothetical protein
MTVTRGPLRAVLSVVAAVALIGVAACSARSADPAGGDRAKLLDRAGAEQEYQRTVEQLRLPAGARFPASIPETEEETMYESGYASSIAENYWICSWAKEWLSQRSVDPEREAAAMSQLEQAPQTRFMTRHLDETGRQFFADHLTKARLGDPSGFQQYVHANCQGD